MTTFLQEGDIFEVDSEFEVYAEVPEHFVYENAENNWNLTRTQITPFGIFSYFQGKYVVTSTAMDGGGTGHGPGDVYPDGYHVYAEKLSNSSIEIDFYQSGAFTVVHERVPVISRAKRKWVI
jgi:hypothetical protein